MKNRSDQLALFTMLFAFCCSFFADPTLPVLPSICRRSQHVDVFGCFTTCETRSQASPPTIYCAHSWLSSYTNPSSLASLLT